MRRAKKFVSEVLSTLNQNIQTTGDPIGLKNVYWTEWAKEMNLPRNGDTIILTARMYQMLPYIIQVTDLISSARPFLSRNRLETIVNAGNRLVGDKIIRIKALGSKDLKNRGKKILQGITRALIETGQRPAYLFEEEPYSGVLLYDLGLDKYIEGHIKRVYTLLKSHGVKNVIGVDPHTVFMLREIYPRYINNFDIVVKHYLEVLSENYEMFSQSCKKQLNGELVIHDSCYITRELGVVEQTRKVLGGIGIITKEPENTKLETACCGGPIEYAFEGLSEEVSWARVKELSPMAKNILVQCPICLINLSKYEKKMDIGVWDMGELLFKAYSPNEDLNSI